MTDRTFKPDSLPGGGTDTPKIPPTTMRQILQMLEGGIMALRDLGVQIQRLTGAVEKLERKIK